MPDNDDTKLNTPTDAPDESVADLVEEAAAEAAEETKSEKETIGDGKIEDGDLKVENGEIDENLPSTIEDQSSTVDLPPSNSDEEVQTEPEQPIVETPVVTDDRPGKWYVVHTYSGHENKVAAALRQRIEAEHLEDKIIDILVPTQNKIEIKSGRKTEVKEKIFPGYILVKMVLDDTSWLAVRTIPGVTSFVGMGNKPTVIPDSEVATIIKYSQIEQPTFKQVFSADDTVRIADGPFAEMIGKVDSVDAERGKVRVLVSIFGRETPVELDFLQVQKI